MQYCEFRAMNSSIVLAAEGTAAKLDAGFGMTRAWIEEQAARFTRFRETSELVQLNRSAGEWVRVSQEMYALLSDAQDLYHETGQLFDPTILDALEQAGYDRTIELVREQGAVARNAVTPLCRAFGIRFDPQRSAVRLPAGVRIDLGGIAKGWIAQRAAEQLKCFSSCCAVNAGGDLFTMGLPRGRAEWEIGLEDPRSPDEDLAVLYVGAGAVATSSIVKRSWQQGEAHRHHLIDPRSLRSARGAWLSVTALAAKGTTAEAFAKAILIAGPAEAHSLTARRDDISYIAIDSHGQLTGTGVARCQPGRYENRY